MGKNKNRDNKKTHKHNKAPKKQMHPRNIYNNKLDFVALGKQFPEFKDCLKQDLTGKISFDFKDEDSLLVLAKVLLKRDFNLNVNIPKGFLVPTISLRLNYILYIEDILNAIGFQENTDEIHGIDIGTGASCIYPLLGAKKNNWHMIGTDNDPECVKIAEQNVDENDLGDYIKVIKSEDKPLFGFVKDDDKVYDFCMCNPPFFDANNSGIKVRNKTRPPPHNASTGRSSETSTEGGEEGFIHQMINESVELRTKIRVYTTMIGCKKNNAALLKRLQEVGVKSIQKIKFFQGRVTRWCIAWTFCDYDFDKYEIFSTLDINHQMNVKSKEKPKKNYVLRVLKTLTCPPITFEEVIDKMEYYFHKLDFACNKYLHENATVFEVQGFENTWSGQRQKNRKELKEKAESSTSVELGKRSFVTSGEVTEKKSKREYDPEVDSLLHVRINLIQTSDDYELTFSNMNNNNDILHQITQYFANQFKTKIQVVTLS